MLSMSWWLTGQNSRVDRKRCGWKTGRADNSWLRARSDRRHLDSDVPSEEGNACYSHKGPLGWFSKIRGCPDT